MIFTRKRINLSNFQLNIDNHVIERQSAAKFLGVIVDEKLSWANHIQAIKTKMSRYIGIMYKLKRQIPIQARLQIFQSFVQSHLNYCSLVWGFASKSHIETLFAKQKQGIRAVMTGFVNYRYKDGKPPDHTKSAFQQFNILTVHGVITKNALTMLHKVNYMPSQLPRSIVQLFPKNMPKYASSYEENTDWLKTYSQQVFRPSVFYNGPMLFITEHNIKMTSPSSLFSINIYKKSLRSELVKLQSEGDENIWPNFLLFNLPGLRKSPRGGVAPTRYTDANATTNDIDY